MGLNLSHVLGYQQRFYGSVEGTVGTFENAAGADAIKVLSSDIDPKAPQEHRQDAIDGRGEYEFFDLPQEQIGSVELYVAPSGSAGTAPDCDPLLQCFFGEAATVVGGTSVTYNLNDTQQLDTMSWTRVMNVDDAIFGEFLRGWLCNEWKLSLSGGEPAKMSFTGEAMGYAVAHYAVASGSGSGTTALTVGTGEGDGFSGTFGVVSVGSTDDLTVSAVSSDSITLGSTATWSDSDVVRPYQPTPTTAGSPISHTLGSFSLGGSEAPITDFELTGSNNLNYFKDEYGNVTFDDAAPGKRTFRGKFTIRARRDYIVEMGRRRLHGDRAISVVMGSTAGAIGTLTLATCRLVPGKMDVPLDGSPASMGIEFMAIDSAEGAADAAVLAFT